MAPEGVTRAYLADGTPTSGAAQYLTAKRASRVRYRRQHLCGGVVPLVGGVLVGFRRYLEDVMPRSASWFSKYSRIHGSSFGYSIWSRPRSFTFSDMPMNWFGGWSAR